MDQLFIGKGESESFLLPQMANRHGLIASATGTGKTVTLQTLAEGVSRIFATRRSGSRWCTVTKRKPSTGRRPMRS